MVEIQNELIKFIKKELFEHLCTLDEFKGYRIRKVEWLDVFKVVGVPNWPGIVSGKEFCIRPEGQLRFFADEEHGAKGVTLSFWAIDMRVRFSQELENWEILDLGNFQGFDR